MTKNLFIGIWKLISFESQLENDEVVYLLGKNPIGYLMYFENGYMSVNIMKADRLSPAFDDVTTMNQAEKASMAETFLAYCGKYEILTDKVIHYPEVSLIPNWVGIKLERTYQMRDNQLILSTPPAKIGNTSEISKLIWERVST